MNRLKVIIADDEALVRERLMSLVSTIPRFEVVALCSSAEETIGAVEEHLPDIMFLDIQMPGGDGFEVLDKIKRAEILIIFVTAYEQFALKAFEYAAFDYLLKPITELRFNRSVTRLLSFYEQQNSNQIKMITIKEKGVYHKINVAEITHLEASDNYVKIFKSDHIYRQRITLSGLMGKLENMGFIRVHRSYIVNERHIRELARLQDGDFLIRLSNGRIVPTSKSFRTSVKQLRMDSLDNNS